MEIKSYHYLLLHRYINRFIGRKLYSCCGRFFITSLFLNLICIFGNFFWKYGKFLTQQHKFLCQLYFVFFADKIWKILLLPPSSFITKRSFCVVKEAKINPMECLFAFLSPLLSLLDTIGTNQKSESDNYFLVCVLVFPVCVKIYFYCFFDHITKSDWLKIR